MPTRSGRHRRRVCLVGASLVLTGAAGGAVAGADGDTPAGSYRISAYGDAIQIQLLDTGAPVVPDAEVVAASPATAATYVDSIGQSSGFAGGPYPGATIISLPGTYNAVRDPNAPEAPGYPFYVHSNSPGEPEAETSYAQTTLKSTSMPNESRAEARSGALAGSPSVATAMAATSSRIDPASGLMTAVSDVALDGLTLGPDVMVGHISGHAKLSTTSGGNPTKESAFEVGSLTVADQKIGLTDEGFVGADGPTELPDLSPVNTITSPAGITLTYLPAEESPNSIQSAGLSATFRHTVPNHGDVTVKVTFGRVAVHVESLGGSAPVTVDLGDLGGPVDGGDASAPTPSASAVGGSGTGGDVPGGSSSGTYPKMQRPSAGSAASPRANPDTVSDSGPDTGSASRPAPAAQGEDQVALAWREEVARLASGYQRGESHDLYLALLVAGLIVLVGGLLFGRRPRLT